MNRKDFLRILSAGSGSAAITPFAGFTFFNSNKSDFFAHPGNELSADVVIAGGGLGGCAAALAALRNGLSVILTEETGWIGGQLTQQGIPPDEHRWIETHGATRLYRELRTKIRQYYLRNYPLTKAARNQQYLNPGNGSVSRLCIEPRAALAVLNEMFAPNISNGKLKLLLNCKITGAEVDGDKVKSLKAEHPESGKNIQLIAPYFADATELGDLLPFTGTEYVTGSESKKETNELHASDIALPDNHQAFTYCLAMDYMPGSDNVIDKPRDYDFWRSFEPQLSPSWPGKLLSLVYTKPNTLEPWPLGFDPENDSTGNKLNLWKYRRVIDKNNFEPGFYSGDISAVNWPQNDYLPGNLFDTENENAFAENSEKAKQLSLSLFYWLQTEVPRPDGGQGWPGLRLRGDIMGTDDGLAKYPYVRESRRIKANFTILEEHVGKENRVLASGDKDVQKAADFYDSVGIGSYHIDLHPTSGGDNYIDFASLPFQIPLGALLPQRMENLLPANKNIGTTHITNGCYRLHPVEWNIGESVGMLVSFAVKKKTVPQNVRENSNLLNEFQNFIRKQGIETHWPD